MGKEDVGMGVNVMRWGGEAAERDGEGMDGTEEMGEAGEGGLDTGGG